MSDITPPHQDRPFLAIGIMACTVFIFTLIDTSAKWLILGGMTAIQVVVSRYVGAFIVNLVVFVGTGGWSEFHSNHPWLQLLRAVVLLGSTILNFMALTYLPITLAVAFFFAVPIVTTLLSIPILGEKVGIRRFLAVLVGFFGVLIIIQPWDAQFHWAVIFSIGALITASFYFVLTRLLTEVDRTSTCQLWSTGVATLCLLPILAQGISLPETQWGIFVYLFIGVMGAFSHIFVTLAYRYAPAKTVAPVAYVQVIYAAGAGYFVFNMLPTPSTALGTAVIITSSIYIWWRERKRDSRAQ